MVLSVIIWKKERRANNIYIYIYIYKDKQVQILLLLIESQFQQRLLFFNFFNDYI